MGWPSGSPTAVSSAGTDIPHQTLSIRAIFDRVAVARFACAAVLIVAALMKIHQLATNPAIGLLRGSRWLQVLLIDFELLLATALLVGAKPKWCRRVTLLTFTGFGAVSLYLGASGAASCGCFGNAHINPWWTFTLDCAAVLLTWPWKPVGSGPECASQYVPTMATSFSIAIATLCVLVATGVSVLAAAGLFMSGASDDGVSPSNGSFTLLEPEKWVGKPFPVSGDIDIGERLLSCSWLVVFVHHDCTKCQEVIPKYERLAGTLTSDPNVFRIAFVEVPPYASISSIARGVCENGRLSDRLEWFITTPCEVTLNDGQVVAVAAGEESSWISGTR